eukprot:3896627-Pyramimonas_sp.AAC.1
MQGWVGDERMQDPVLAALDAVAAFLTLIEHHRAPVSDALQRVLVQELELAERQCVVVWLRRRVDQVVHGVVLVLRPRSGS